MGIPMVMEHYRFLQLWNITKVERYPPFMRCQIFLMIYFIMFIDVQSAIAISCRDIFRAPEQFSSLKRPQVKDQVENSAKWREEVELKSYNSDHPIIKEAWFRPDTHLGPRTGALGRPGSFDSLSFIMTALINGADINFRDQNGYTPIMHAELSGRYHLFNALLKLGADLRIENNDGLTVVHIREMLRLYENRIPDLTFWSKFQTVQGIYVGEAVLDALQSRDFNSLRRFFENGIDPNTFLMDAARFDGSLMARAARNNDIEMMDFLKTEYDVRVDRDPSDILYDHSLILYPVRTLSKDALVWLRDNGANLNIPISNKTDTNLIRYLFSHAGRPEVVVIVGETEKMKHEKDSLDLALWLYTQGVNPNLGATTSLEQFIRESEDGYGFPKRRYRGKADRIRRFLKAAEQMN